MKKIIFFVSIGALLFAFRVSTEAQQTKKVPRIGVLASGTLSSMEEVLARISHQEKMQRLNNI